MHGSDVVAFLSSLSGAPSVIDIILGIRSIIGIHLQDTLKTSPSPRPYRPTALHNDVPS
jgi:hypothetical protein